MRMYLATCTKQQMQLNSSHTKRKMSKERTVLEAGVNR